MDTTRYQDLRPLMRTGDLLAFAGSGWLSRRIIAHDGRYSHVAMVLRQQPYEVVRVTITHAVFSAGVIDLPVSRYLQAYRGRAWWVPMDHDLAPRRAPDYQRIIMDQAIFDRGRPYDWRGALSHRLPWVQPSAEALYCSEEVGLCLRRVGFSDKTDLTPSEATQLDIYQAPQPRWMIEGGPDGLL